MDQIFAQDPVITHGPRISLWTPYFNLAADPLFLVLDPYSGVDPVSNGDPVSNRTSTGARTARAFQLVPGWQAGWLPGTVQSHMYRAREYIASVAVYSNPNQP